MHISQLLSNDIIKAHPIYSLQAQPGSCKPPLKCSPPVFFTAVNIQRGEIYRINRTTPPPQPPNHLRRHISQSPSEASTCSSWGDPKTPRSAQDEMQPTLRLPSIHETSPQFELSRHRSHRSHSLAASTATELEFGDMAIAGAPSAGVVDEHTRFGGCAKWTPREDQKLIVLRTSGLKWLHVARELPGRSQIACRLRWRNHLAASSSDAENLKTRLAKCYAKHKEKLYSRIAADLDIPPNAAESMLWQIGFTDLKRRALEVEPEKIGGKRKRKSIVDDSDGNDDEDEKGEVEENEDEDTSPKKSKPSPEENE